MAHEKWMQRQMGVLTELGVNPLDAQASLRAFLALLPDWADPDTYVVPAEQMEQDITRPELQTDAVAAWVSDDAIPTRFKLILVASDG
jgi:hypothetical protein